MQPAKRMPSRREPPDPSAGNDMTRAQEARAAAEDRAETALALFSAVARLHDASSRADVLCAIEEIAAGCLRSPDVAVWLHDAASDRLLRARVAGPQAAALVEEAELLQGVVDRAAAERRIVVGPEVGPGARHVAVPLGTGWTSGVMLLLSMPMQGEDLSADLRQRLSIVGRHVGIALARSQG
jgi:hypothetical protein